jgi:callose synthase
MGTIQMLLGGLGLLQTIPLFATLGVERGWWASIQEIFLRFRAWRTSAFHVPHSNQGHVHGSDDIGRRGKVSANWPRIRHTTHAFRRAIPIFSPQAILYLGVELAAGLILMAIYTDAGQYAGRTWSLWLASLSFLASPFWFNPLTFDWNVVTYPTTTSGCVG